MKNQAFTLIEILVVVLIIGILAAIAVPQYQYAVLKSRYHTLMDMARAVKDAEEVYYLQNGQYAESFSDLDISMPVGGVVGETPNVINYEDKTVLLSSTQVLTRIVKNGNPYMDYNLKLDNGELWGGARALCVSWGDAGATGQKVCNDLTDAPESCVANSIYEGRYTCRLYK